MNKAAAVLLLLLFLFLLAVLQKVMKIFCDEMIFCHFIVLCLMCLSLKAKQNEKENK